jgi:acetylornithine deacetylase/succinyl-diaminopimelate desuccinylase-like protein
MQPIDLALAYAQAQQARFQTELVDYVAIPSVSAQPERHADVLRAAEWLQQRMRDAGLRSEIMPSDGNPVVYGEWLGAPGAPTLLIYGHYDVQPAEPFDLWTTPAFTPTVVDGALVGRGSDDNKGQHLVHLNAVEAWLKGAGKLPVNIKFIVEGEEEIGGPSLPAFVKAKAGLLACDAVVVSDGTLYSLDRPSITYGLRGLAQLEITVRALGRDVHSGHYGGNVQNPAIALAQILAGLKDEHGRVNIPNFYDEVRPLTSDERAEIANVPWSIDDVARETGATQAFGDPDFTPNERKGARPTLEVNGMWSGYTGPGSKTIIPATAHCKFTMRLVPFMDPKLVAGRLIERIKALTPPGVTVEFSDTHGTVAAFIDPNGPFFSAAARAAERTYGNPPYYELEGGSIPVVSDFIQVLGKPVVLLGLGLSGDLIHSPNERFPLACYTKGTECSIRLIAEVAAL